MPWLVTSAATGYLLLFAWSGWIPHDEGLLAQSAERVIGGELPHRDFDEMYTGGLTYLHALAFRTLGTSLATIRVVLLLFSIPFFAAVYAIAARVVAPATAAVVTLLALVWSVPNYFASMPSWYNLFFATFGTWALLQFSSTGRRLWIFAAGVCGGLSVLAKISGVYFVAAAVLYCVYHEQLAAASSRRPAAARGSRAYAALISAALLVFVVGLAQLIRAQLDLRSVVHFVVPAAALGLFLALSEWRHGRGGLGARLSGLARRVVPLFAGFAIPIAGFALFFAASGGLDELIRGLFVLPRLRLALAASALPELKRAWTVLPYAAIVLLPFVWRTRWHRVVAPAVAVGGAVLLAIAWIECGETGLDAAGRAQRHDVYRAVWHSVRPLVPVLAIGAVLALAGARRGSGWSDARRADVFLLASVASLVSLVQYPYSLGIYFCYAAPLVILALLYVVAGQESPPWKTHTVVLAFYLVFGLAFLNPGYVRAKGVFFFPDRNTEPLDWQRGGLMVDSTTGPLYRQLRDEVLAHTEDGEYIYAAPDCPEVAFLTARRNPTRTMYDFFDDPESREQRILRLLDERDVRLAVINLQPEFTPMAAPNQVLADGLAAGLAARFPESRTIGRFVVLWRD